MRNLLRLLLARHAVYVLASGLLLGGFQWLICAVVASTDVTGALGTLVQSLPPMVQSMVSEQFFGGFSKASLLAFGWEHPIAQAVGAALAIVLATQAVAGESETGTIELTLGQPIARSTYLAAHVVFALAALALVTLAGLAGTVAGGRVYGLETFRLAALARLGLDYLALQAALFGLTLVFSAFGREGGRVSLFGFLCALVSYLVHVIGTMWDGWKPLVPYTLHAYYVPKDLLVKGAGVTRPAATLLAAALGGLLVAWWRFRRRDLP
jgi:ABC-type transport system involved in multi-copper enzyme maturation permease subunit